MAPIEASSGDQYVMQINSAPLEEAGFELSFGGDATLDCILVSADESNRASTVNFTLFPTISKGLLTFIADDPTILGGQLSIRNLHGQQVYMEEHITLFRHAIDLTNFTDGFYIATVQKGHLLLSKKFLLQK